MDETRNGHQLRFSDLMNNPHIQTLVDGLVMMLPGAHWRIFDERLEQRPFPFQNPVDVASEGPEIRLERFAAEPQALEIGPGPNGSIQGIAALRFQDKYLGGIGICKVDHSRRDVLLKTLRMLESYFSLLSGVLEDHDDLELINNLWNDTICMVDLEDLLERLFNELCATLKVARGAILLIDDDGDFYPAKVKGLPESLKKKKNISLTKYDYINRIADFSDSYYFMGPSDPFREWLYARLRERGEEPGSGVEAIAVPFLRGNDLIGLFVTLIPKPFQFSIIKEYLLQIFSSGGAAALENALTSRRVDQCHKALSTIHTVHRLISSDISTGDLLPRIGQLTRQLLKVKKCAILMYDRTRRVLVPGVQLGLAEGEVGSRQLALGEELPGWVAENFNAIIYYPSDDPPWKPGGDLYPAESYLAAPLYDNDIEGVIVTAGKSGDFTPGDRDILMTFAEQIVLAVKNVRLHEGERTITLKALKSIANLVENLDPLLPGVTSKACNLAERIGRHLQMSQRDLHNLVFASLLHDTGMLRSLYTSLPEDEHRLKGPKLSFHVVQSLNLPHEVGQIVYHVNEAWNGQGYPDGLKGSQIPLGSRIIAITTAYATLHGRYVKRGEDPAGASQRAMRVLERLSRNAFDPDIVHALRQILLHTPPGEAMGE